MLENDEPYFFKLLLFVGSACHSADTFLKTFMAKPDAIKQLYVPFVQNIKVHFGCQAKI